MKGATREKTNLLCGDHQDTVGRSKKNKAGYTAQDAPSTRLKITWDGRTNGRTYGTDGRTDTPSYRNATAHLKT